MYVSICILKNVHLTYLKYSREMFLEIIVEKANLRIFMTRTIRPDKFENLYTEMMAKNVMTLGQYFPTG